MAVAEAVAEAALFSCHLERNDVQSKGLNAENDFRTRNKERQFLIVRVKSVKMRFIRDIRVPDLQSWNDESSITNWR